MRENPFDSLDLNRITERHKLEDLALAMAGENLNKALGMVGAVECEGAAEIRASIRTSIRLLLDASEKRDRLSKPLRPRET